MITLDGIVEKRKKIWRERHDIDYDRAFVRAAAIKILSTPSLVRAIRDKPYRLIEAAFYIVDKKRETVPFFFNEVQRSFIGELERHGTSRPFLILKGRQQGFTSLITAIQLSYAVTRHNFSGFTVADRSDNTQAIFNDKARTVYERLPDELKPSEKFNSRNELFFDKLNSSWRIATASDKVGRSRTLNFVHFSEVAFYSCSLSALQAGIGEAVASDAVIIYETTANGFNQTKELWDSGSCVNLFYEWWHSAEYRSAGYESLNTRDPWLFERIRMLEERGLDRAQIAWYCEKYASYIDKTLIRQEYPITADEAFVAAGDCVFDKDILSNRIAECIGRHGDRVGGFKYERVVVPVRNAEGVITDSELLIKNVEFVESADGFITIHEEPRVRKDDGGTVTHRAPYVIGADTAGSGKDYFTAKVVCNLNGKTVATLRKQNIDEDLFAEQLYCLGKYYHDALIGVEINYSRGPIRTLSRRLGYTELYRRERLGGDADIVGGEFGFETNSRTRPIIISELVELMRTEPRCECDVETLREMCTFVRRDNGRCEAAGGCHDDLVMAKAIAHFISHGYHHDWIPVSSENENFIDESFNLKAFARDAYLNWEDY